MNMNDNDDTRGKSFDAVRHIIDNAETTQGSAYAVFVRLVTMTSCMQSIIERAEADPNARRLARDASFEVVCGVGCALCLTRQQMHAAATTAMTVLKTRAQS